MPNHKNDDHIYDGNDDSQINDRTIVIGQSVEYGDDEKEIITKRGTVTRIRGKLELDDEDIEFRGTTRYDKVEIGGGYDPGDRPLQVYSGSKENELFNIEAVDTNNNFKTTLGTDLIVNGDIIGGNGTLNVKSDLVVGGDLYIDGTLTTTNAKVLEVDDYQIILGNTSEEGGPSDSTASGGGIILRGTKDKTILWDATNGWKSSEKITASKGFVGDLDGNASTVTNGVYTSGNQTINGVKKFSSTIDGSISGNAGTVTNGVYTNTAQTITGVKTFNSIPIFSGGTSGSTAPFKVDSTFLVENLNADLLDGQEGSYYRNASNINAGTLAIARGGTNITTYAKGDILYASDTNTLSKLTKGNDGQVLKLVDGIPSWGTDNNTNTASAANDILEGSNTGTVVKYSPYSTASAGRLSKVVPTTGTTTLGYSGHFYTNRLYTPSLYGGTASRGNLTIGSTSNATKGTITLDSNTEITKDLTVDGDLIVNGSTTTISTTNLKVKDKNIELGFGDTMTDVTASGGGITLRGTTNKTILWNASNGWVSSEKITASKGFVGDLTGSADLLDGEAGSYYTTADNLTGTIPSTVLGNSSIHIGTTEVALNRASATLALTGVTNTNWDSAYTDTNAATNTNTHSTIVKRDSSGDFSAGIITASLSGNATSATRLQTARTIAGVSFNGSANIGIPLGNLSNVSLTSLASGQLLKYNGTNWVNGTETDPTVPSWAKTAAPSATSSRFMRMNTNNTILWQTAANFRSDIGAAASSHNHSTSNITSGTLGVARGGTGRSSITSGAFIIGAGTTGTSAVTMQGNSTSNRVSGTKYFTNLDLSENLNFASDERMKSKHFKFDDKDMLKKLSSVDIYEYNFLNKPDETKIGLMAQDLQESFPEIELVENNGYNEEYDLEDSLAIKHDKLTYVLWSALKGANERIDELEERLSKLEGLINKE